MHKKITRKDGSVVILVPKPDSKSVTVEVLFKVGSRHGTRAISGASHFVEHMLFKGTRRRPTSRHISRELDSIGAEYNAFTGKDHTGYYVQAASNNFTTACDMLADMFYHSRFDQKEIDRERTVIIQEMKMYRDNPIMNIHSVFESAFFKGSSLSMDIGGPDSVLKTITRKQLTEYMHREYRGGNMVVGVEGAFAEKEAIAFFNSFFPPRRRSQRSGIAKFVSKRTKADFIIDKKETEQAQLMLGFPGVSHTHRDNEALTLLGVIMGGTMSSRLFETIREKKGLAYMIKAWSESFEDTGYFAVQAGVDTSKITAALRAITSELDRVARRGVTSEELARAKANISGRLILKFENPSVYLSYLMSQELLTGTIVSLDQELKRIARVTRADVNRVARSRIRWPLVQGAVIGPYQDKKSLLSALRPSET